jgi:hypothetical protein
VSGDDVAECQLVILSVGWARLNVEDLVRDER